MSDPFKDIEDARALAQAIVDTVREPLLVLDGDLRVLAVSRSYYLTFRVDRQDVLGRPLYALGDGVWQIPALRMNLEKIIPERAAM
ncbi:MAG: PAS domain-containing protein, partial [Methylocella sp.]